MNKYQGALSRIERFSNYWNNTERVNNNLEPHFNILQELVDRATPKKVKCIMNNVIYGDHHSTGYCPNCNTYLDIPSEVWYHVLAETDYFSCGCGQKLDWTDTD